MSITVTKCRRTSRNTEDDTASLSRRDIQLAQLVAEGRQNKEIAFILGLTEGTVKCYMSTLFIKLGVANRAELAAWTARGSIAETGESRVWPPDRITRP